VSEPVPGSYYDSLYGVTAISVNDIWAVGAYSNDGGTSYLTLMLHWDGTAWSQVPSPNQTTFNDLRSVAATAPNDVWAVGLYSDCDLCLSFRTLIEHWDGSAWTIVSSPNGNRDFNRPRGIAVESANSIWTVGYSDQYNYPYLSDTLIMRQFCPSSGSPTATSTPSFATVTPTATPAAPTPTVGAATNTPLPPTNTPTASPATATPVLPTSTPPGQPTTTPLPTNTATPTATATNTPVVSATNTPGMPTATPTDCANPFVDVASNVFYPAIHYLNCRGVINGTDATHYSPAGTATRGQFAKVVVLGFGLTAYTPPGAPDFSDVPPNYFAYVYIETGFHNGVLSGFDAAGCTAHGATPPCYLPNIPITRGQLTKLVVNAARYPLYTPTSGQTFSDVPASNVFFTSIETAAHKGVIAGYPDHSFRPNNPIRRDEMAQIVYKAVTTP